MLRIYNLSDTTLIDDESNAFAFVTSVFQRLCPSHLPTCSQCVCRDGLAPLRNMLLELGALHFACPVTGREFAGNLSLTCQHSEWNTVPIIGYIIGSNNCHQWSLIWVGMDRCTFAGLVNLETGTAFALGDTSTLPNKPGGYIFTWYNWYVDAPSTIKQLPSFDAHRSIALPLLNSHFAHHLWNELSLVDWLENSPPAKSGEIQYLVRAEPLGPLESLFPVVRPSRIERLTQPPKLTQFEAFYDRLNRGDAFTIPSGFLTMSSSFVQRLNQSFANSHKEADSESAHFHASCYPFIIVTVRAEHRTMVNFSSVMAELLEALSLDHPHLGVVFDGTSIPPWDSPARQEVLSELALIGSITSQLPKTIKTHSIAGKDFGTAFVWSRHADFYLSHHGSLQHKVAWLSGIPGVVHVGDNWRGSTDQFLDRTLPDSTPRPDYVFFPTYGQPADIDARRDLLNYTGHVEPLLSALESLIARTPARLVDMPDHSRA